MAVQIHIFDTTGPEPCDDTQVTVHCGKSLVIKDLKGQGKVKKCTECFEKSRRFMESHPNVFVHTVFVGEELQEEPQEVTTIISKRDWRILSKNGGSVGMIQVFSEGELHEKFGDKPEQYIMRVKITPVTE